MKTLLSVLIMSLSLTGCVKLAEGVDKDATNNGQFTVDVLFTDGDGCKVKRFRDGDSRYKYYVTCPGRGAGTTQWTESCGKNCTTTVGVMGSDVVCDPDTNCNRTE